MFFLAITFIPVAIYLLHFVTNIRTKDDLKRRIINLYVILGDLSEDGRFYEALAHLRKTMERSKKWFLIYYACVSFACIVSTLPGLISVSREKLENDIIKLSDTVIDLHFNVSFDLGMAVVGQNFFYLDNGTNCVLLKNALNFVDSKPGQKEKVSGAVRSFSDDDIKWVFALSEIMSDVFTFLTVGLAIVISMKVTVFVLSRLNSSRLWLLFSVVLSLAVALLSPFVMIELSTYIAVTSIVIFKSGLPDFFSIVTPTVLSVALANATTVTLVLLNPESILAVVLQKSLPESWVFIAVSNGIISVSTLSLSWGRLISFIHDLVRFNSFDFDETGLEGVRNWGVGTDIAFSLSYLILSLMLICAYRTETVREYMLKELQEIDSSVDGPLLSIANKTKILMGAFLALVGIKG